MKKIKKMKNIPQDLKDITRETEKSNLYSKAHIPHKKRKKVNKIKTYVENQLDNGKK